MCDPARKNMTSKKAELSLDTIAMLIKKLN